MGSAINLMLRLRTVFRDIFDDDTIDISVDMTKDNFYNWDSLAHVKLVLSVEEEFDIRLSTDEVLGINSVGDFVSAINNHSKS